jgi:uncharacterized protein (DUF433 family)
MWYEQHIAQYEGVCGGDPVVAGTRTPVATIAMLYEHVYPLDVDGVNQSLPHLTREQVLAALAYYDDHRAEIDAQIIAGDVLFDHGLREQMKRFNAVHDRR